MLILLGSKTSPFVRRVRLYLESLEVDYQFEIVDVYSPLGQSRLKELGPVRKVPMLLDGEVIVSDSRQILSYITKKFGKPILSVEEEEIFTAINSANDDLVLQLMLQRSGFDLNSDSMLISNVKKRSAEIYTYLDQLVADGHLKIWNVLTMSLYALLDWSSFRQLIKIENYLHLQQFLLQNKNRPEVERTAIPKDA